MHRSGTSLAASMMAALSVQLGDQLLPADSHNQAGYFEDVTFLDFHRQVLSQCVPDEPGHSDWGWTESERLDIRRFSEFRDQARRVINVRIHDAGPWGWKDPRTTLFLDFWDSLLEEARFVFVYRFPWDVADSMQRLGAEVFLKNPEYAYRIWEFYNRRLRDFYVQHSDRCLLVNINALQKNLDRFVCLLGDKLGVPTRESRLQEVFKDHLFQTIAGEDPLIDLVSEAWPGCAQLLSELEQLADISGEGLWRPRPVRSRLSRPDAIDKEPIDVSVVTPCYEQGTLLLEAIASTERHAPPRCELIIVNDGSQQPTTLAILELLKRCGYFVIDQENAGLSAARNRAIGLARGRYILPLDDDNRLREGFVDEAVRVLDSSPKVGIVYGDRYDFGLRSGIEKLSDFELDSLLNGNYIDACAVFRKQVWIDCQGYDSLMCPLDDWELWIHAAERGWHFHHIARVTFDYRVRPASLITQIDSREKDADLRKRIRVKHSELYRAKSLEELEDQKRLVEDQKQQVEDLKRQVEDLKRLVEDLRRQVADQTDLQNRLTDERDLLVIQLAERDARIERMINSRGWRLLMYYSRFKHRYLLPVYRLFVQTTAERTEPKPVRSNSEGRIPGDD